MLSVVSKGFSRIPVVIKEEFEYSFVGVSKGKNRGVSFCRKFERAVVAAGIDLAGPVFELVKTLK